MWALDPNVQLKSLSSTPPYYDLVFKGFLREDQAHLLSLGMDTYFMFPLSFPSILLIAYVDLKNPDSPKSKSTGEKESSLHWDFQRGDSEDSMIPELLPAGVLEGSTSVWTKHCISKPRILQSVVLCLQMLWQISQSQVVLFQLANLSLEKWWLSFTFLNLSTQSHCG